jgi:hypothetical protein
MGKEGSTNFWFRPRRYGHGALPSTWQGWATILAFVIIFPLLALALFWAMPNLLGIIAVVNFIPAAVLGFIAFVRKKTDGEWRWRWGDDKVGKT